MRTRTTALRSELQYIVTRNLRRRATVSIKLTRVR